jgi:hypothetical protein
MNVSNAIPCQQYIKRELDWKTFCASSIFFFFALMNIRDFPIPNVPLIYPAFLLFLIWFGPRQVLEGFRSTKYICILLASYWFYLMFIKVTKGGAIEVADLPYLLEPLLVFGVTGTATARPGGTKAALWAVVSVIVLSTACGIWIYFIGEPVKSWSLILQSSKGGNVLQGAIGDIAIPKNLLPGVNINAGLTAQVYSFSYQLSVALLITITAMLSMKRSISKKYISLLGVLGILFVGMITNAERATVLSVSTGLLTFFFIKGRKIINIRVTVILMICIFAILALLSYSSQWEDHHTLGKRTAEENIYIRGIVMPIEAIKSVFSEPLGAAGMSQHYIDVSFEKGWVKLYRPKASHNHFSNVIMYTGIVGLFLVISLFSGLRKLILKVRYYRFSELSNEACIPIAVCIAIMIHSLTHNDGFFEYEPATAIVFGLLWGVTATMRYRRYNNLLKKWVIE